HSGLDARVERHSRRHAHCALGAVRSIEERCEERVRLDGRDALELDVGANEPTERAHRRREAIGAPDDIPFASGLGRGRQARVVVLENVRTPGSLERAERSDLEPLEKIPNGAQSPLAPAKAFGAGLPGDVADEDDGAARRFLARARVEGESPELDLPIGRASIADARRARATDDRSRKGELPRGRLESEERHGGDEIERAAEDLFGLTVSQPEEAG